MIELYVYKLINALVEAEIPDIKYVDFFKEQYNNLSDNTNPLDKASLLIEFQKRENVITTLHTKQEGLMDVRYHVVVPRMDTNSPKRKNVNNSFRHLELATSVNKLINNMDSSKYESGTTVYHLELNEGTNFLLETGHLSSSEVKYTNEFSIVILTFTHRYVDLSCSEDIDFSTGWTYTTETQVVTTPNSIQEGDFNSDFSGDFDLTPQEAKIYYHSVTTGVDFVSISGYSFSEEGIPLEMEYSINNGINWQDDNLFTGLSGGTYAVIIRNSRGDGLHFDQNPVVVG